MAIDPLKLNNMTDVPLASSLASGELKVDSQAEWRYIQFVRPEALKIYAVVLGVLGYPK